MSATGINTPQQEPDGDEGMTAPGVQKGSEQGRQEGADSVMQPGAAPKEQGMAPWQDKDDVKKAFATIAKAMQSSGSDSPTANDDGDKRLNERTDEDDENINEVAKALSKMLGKKPVAKSMGTAQTPGVDLTPILTVMKSMADRQARTDAILGEILEGLGVAPAVPAENSVQKSQGANPSGRPYAGMDAGNLVDVIATAVAKSMAAAGNFQQSASGIPVAKGFEPSKRGDAIRGFTEGFAQISQDRWGDVPATVEQQ